jgi:hypothetical protein
MGGKMDTIAHGQFVADDEIQAILQGTGSNSAEERLAVLRALSNISQALENLVMQCRACDGFKDIESFAEVKLRFLKREMQIMLHG